MSLLSDALQAHASRLNESAGETVTLRRGSDSVSFTAVLGQSDFEDRESTGDAVISLRSFDFLVRPSLLVLGGEQVEPQRGDQIVNTAGDVFDVMTGSDGNVWRWSDHHKTMYRIHTTKR